MGPAIGSFSKSWWTYENIDRYWNQEGWAGFGLQTTLSKRWYFVEPTIALFIGLFGEQERDARLFIDRDKDVDPFYIQIYCNFILD